MPVLEAPTASARLDALLNESVDDATRREQTAFDEFVMPLRTEAGPVRSGSVWPAYTFAGLRRIGLEPLAFADNNARLWGQQVEGIPVFSPSEAAQKFADNAAFVVTIWNGSARDRLPVFVKQLTSLGCRRTVPVGFLFWKYPDIFRLRYPLDLPHKLLAAGPDAVHGFPSLERMSAPGASTSA